MNSPERKRPLGPSYNLLTWVQDEFKLKGTTLGKWAAQQGLHYDTVVRALSKSTADERIIQLRLQVLDKLDRLKVDVGGTIEQAQATHTAPTPPKRPATPPAPVSTAPMPATQAPQPKKAAARPAAAPVAEVKALRGPAGMPTRPSYEFREWVKREIRERSMTAVDFFAHIGLEEEYGRISSKLAGKNGQTGPAAWETCQKVIDAILAMPIPEKSKAPPAPVSEVKKDTATGITGSLQLRAEVHARFRALGMTMGKWCRENSVSDALASLYLKIAVPGNRTQQMVVCPILEGLEKLEAEAKAKARPPTPTPTPAAPAPAPQVAPPAVTTSSPETCAPTQAKAEKPPKIAPARNSDTEKRSSVAEKPPVVAVPAPATEPKVQEPTGHELPPVEALQVPIRITSRVALRLTLPILPELTPELQLMAILEAAISQFRDGGCTGTVINRKGIARAVRWLRDRHDFEIQEVSHAAAS